MLEYLAKMRKTNIRNNAPFEAFHSLKMIIENHSLNIKSQTHFHNVMYQPYYSNLDWFQITNYCTFAARKRTPCEEKFDCNDTEKEIHLR